MDELDGAVARLTASESRVTEAETDGLVGARCVEILPGGSESREVGGAVVEASLPPIATAEVAVADDSDSNVVVCENVWLPAGGLVEMQYAITVDLEVLDEHARPPPPPPPDEQVCAVRFAPRLRRDESGGWRRDGEDVRMTEAALP